MPEQDVRVLVPRVRRALEGAGAPPKLTNDAVKDVVADALSDILLYTGSVFGKTLDVTATDVDGGFPTEYATSDPLSLAEGSVVAAQAALTFFFHQFSGVKVSQQISDEAQTWQYSLSATLLRDQLKLLQDERDKALEALENTSGLESYVSFIGVRDVLTSRAIEPWVERTALGGMSDVRFDMVV
jgi:hypothetical protein